MNESEESINLSLIPEITEVKDTLIRVRLKNKEDIKFNQWIVENNYDPIFMDYSVSGGSLTTIKEITDSYMRMEIKKISFDFLKGKDNKKEIRENISTSIRYIFIHSIDSIEMAVKPNADVNRGEKEYRTFTLVEESLMPRDLYEYHMQAKSRGV